MDQEALLPFDNTSPSYNINPNFTNVEKNYQNTLTLRGNNDCFFILFELACLSICITAAVLLISFNYLNWSLPFIAWSLFLAILWSVMHGISVKKVELIKNGCTNQLILKITKKCFCSKQYTLNLENAYLFYQKDIILLNTLKNTREFDLDNSNITKNPINLINKYEILSGLRGVENEIQLKIDEFLRQKKYENNIYDEIDKYNSLYNKNYSKDKKKIFDLYMKINEYFYTFFYTDNFINDRTDFIYSNDFERLFIGKIYKDKYNKTLLINLNEIITFEMFEEKKSDSEGEKYQLFYLKIMYKNEEKEEIIICRNNKLYLEKFVLLLNGKLNDINEMKKNNNSNNYTPQY